MDNVWYEHWATRSAGANDPSLSHIKCVNLNGFPRMSLLGCTVRDAMRDCFKGKASDRHLIGIWLHRPELGHSVCLSIYVIKSITGDCAPESAICVAPKDISALWNLRGALGHNTRERTNQPPLFSKTIIYSFINGGWPKSNNNNNEVAFRELKTPS